FVPVGKQTFTQMASNKSGTAGNKNFHLYFLTARMIHINHVARYNKPEMISVIIINYNSKELLRSCLEGVLSQTYMDREIIFIDNDSQDGSCPFVKEHFPNVTAVCNSD